jgi:O-antigen/teichoic acid export membrane protein
MGMLWLTAAWMGPVLRGQTSMVIALVHGGVLLSGFGAGSGMIYHASRISSKFLWLWSQYWSWSAAFLVGVVSFVLMEWGWGYAFIIGLLTWLHASVASIRGWWLGRGFLQKDNVAGWLIPLLPTLMLGGFYGGQQLGLQVRPTLGLFVGIHSVAMILVLVWSVIQNSRSDVGSRVFLRPAGQSNQDSLPEAGKAMWSFNRWTASANLGQFVVYRIQYLFMMAMLGAAELGVYSVAVVIAEASWVITQSYSTGLLSLLSSQHEAALSDQVRRSWRWSMQALAYTLLPVAFLIFFPISWIHELLGPSYGPIHGLWIALSPGILALACSNVLVQHFTALGRVQVSFFSSWGSALLIFIGLGPAVQLAGVEGIAWWTSVVLVFNTAGVIAFFRKTYKVYL